MSEDGYGSRSAYLDALAMALVKTREAMDAAIAYWMDLPPYQAETEKTLSGSMYILDAMKRLRVAQSKADWWPEEEEAV